MGDARTSWGWVVLTCAALLCWLLQVSILLLACGAHLATSPDGSLWLSLVAFPCLGSIVGVVGLSAMAMFRTSTLWSRTAAVTTMLASMLLAPVGIVGGGALSIVMLLGIDNLVSVLAGCYVIARMLVSGEGPCFGCGH